MTDSFDLSRYFARIGYDGPAEPTLDVLRRLHLLHPQAIPFENLNPLTGARVALDLPAVVDKLVARRRGGYCFELNKLFYAALTRIGFRVTPLIARVRWMRPPEVVTAQTHMLLRIDLDGAVWLADIGFGSATLTAPLRFAPGERQLTPHGAFRVVTAPVADEFDMQCEAPDGWLTTYRFSLKPAEWIDYEAANWFTSTYPESIFVNDLIACRVLPGSRAALFNTALTLRDASGAGRTVTLDNAADWGACLRDTIGIDTAGFDLDALFAQVAARPER
ncbi:arylamine N-acetyltransferase family protein [Burkholderia pseudomultivorans]|uniref:N-hydroxyarylamine O-acetyltransferase n=1 Tax=Burkholderia pseudomultivorans TaxID=1207504 RepID=A0ABU2DWY7_9BURK|nr:arylamine N-acetyltransferase [Burkholderia pseudomultivorans]MDR8729385.1 N-hydroxyarylamine O-acetyltransferase [Burkholderia pseudomultivorans]MDR8733749.1 N-hydroxyarylamine O-acetyltransferase [Burkholderia pseudomultivorans]MDR8740275.1 N-hydroxyarylamine O-acetyltransferase [Burkholderia pseudomultivorans]MDR8752056.1 N-hydroxyarylamine O-acetyltransferase [Burkholderia pseudomultivorans]MDR8776450.1 N-hydroxyarylamine O-acetyltransferase [Burkholderia pseudomultivorans]